MKKVLSIFLVLVMVVAVFAGCNNNANQSSASSAASGSSKSAAESSKDEGGTDLVNLSSLVPVVNEPVSMSMAVTVGAMNEEPKDMWFFKYFEEQTGVHFDLVTIQQAAWPEKKPIMMATDDYPDVFFGQPFTAGEIMTYGYDGMFIPLNDLIETYGDKINEKMNTIEGSWANITCGDGNIYALPSLNLGYFFTDGRYWINNVWLENVNKEVPKTVDQFYEALVAFKENDANGNGNATDEIPWSGHSGNTQRGMMLNAYGIVTSGDDTNNVAIDNKGNPVYIPLTAAYKDYLTFMAKCYSEGLLDQDYFTQDDVQMKAKGAEHVIGAAAYAAPFLLDPELPQDWVAMALTANESETPVVYTGSATVIGKFVVTDKCANPEVAIRWANLFYTPEWAFYIMYGPEYGTDQDPDGIGTTIEFDEEGNYREILTPGWDPDEIGLWDYYARNHPVNSNFNFGIDDSYIFAQLFKGRPKNVEEETAYHKNQIDNPTETTNLNEAYWRYSNLINAVPYKAYGYPTVYLSAEQQKLVDELKTPLEDFVKAQETKFITGSLSIETDFDAFLTELEDYRVTEYFQVFQDVFPK